MPTSRPSIPELINSIRHLFRESEFEDELQNALLEREKKMQTEVENLVKVRDLLKKKVDFLEYNLEEKLGVSEKRRKESVKENLGLKEQIGTLMQERLCIEEKLEMSYKKCEDMGLEKCSLEEKLGRREERCEELEEENVGLREKIGMLMHEKLVIEEKFEKSCKKCEDMEKEIEEMRLDKLNVNRTIEELKLKNVAANQTIDELRVKMVELEIGVILMLERRLAKNLNLDVEGVRFLLRRTEDLAGPICVEEVNGNAKGRGEAGYAGAEVVVIESDDDDETEEAVTSKRNRTEDWSRKKRANTYLDDFTDVESTDSDDESCSDTHMNNYIETLRQRRRS